MESSELVSCIITTYNRPQLVGQAIDSVLAQSYKNLELIIIDDHSSESYTDVIEQYAGYANVQFYRNEKNLRLSASRNKGINLSKGQFIAFLDDDDFWLPSKIEKQVATLKSNSEYVACTTCHIESESKKVIDRGIRVFTFENILVVNLLGPPSKMMVRKSLLKQIQFNEEAKHAEDWDFYLKLLKLGSIYMIKEPLTIYNTGHFDRMTNGFSSLTIEQIREKANMTLENRYVIGERNFRIRLANYYFAGFQKRKDKISFFIQVIKEVGFFVTVSTFLKIIKRVIKK